MSPNDRPRRSVPDSNSRHRRPTKRACIDCHARKVKCDAADCGFPCTNCKASNVECAVADRRKRKRHHAVTDTAAASEPEGYIDAERAGAEHAAEEELAKEHLVEFFNQDFHDKPIRARSTYVGSELCNLSYLVRQQGANQHVHHYPSSHVYVPRVFRNAETPVTPNLIPKDAFVLPPTHISDALVAGYFEHVHSGLPIIDKTRFLSLYEDSNTTPSPLLLQAICLVGCHVTNNFPNHQEMKVAFFRRAKALLDGRYEEDRMHVVQAALLLTWFSDGGDDICANAWWWIGIAARTAMGLGMHREVGASKMPDNDKVLWRRIWWCIVQFDCLVTLVHGRPQQVDPDDCDVSPLTTQDFDEWATTTDTSFVIHHARLCLVISELTRSHFSLKAVKSGMDRKEALDAFDKALASWRINLPPELRAYEDDTESPWPAMLHLAYNTALLQFHRLTAGPEDADICADAAATIVQIFGLLSGRSMLPLCWFWAPSALFAAILQVDCQVKCGNPIRALHAKTKYDTSLAVLRRLGRHWLFATSVLRLFQSNSIAGGREDASPNQSPVASLSASGQVVTVQPGQHAEMGWVQPFSYDANMEFPNMERNHWQSHPDQWQSLYFSDPLANIYLGENFGDFSYTS